MNLNDPFGRLARRDQQAYETMRDALRGSGVTTEQAARQIIQHARTRALRVAAVGAAVLLLISLGLPKVLPVTAGMGLLAAVWMIKSTLDGQRYIERYIKEELTR